MLKSLITPLVGIAITWAVLAPIALMVEHNKHNPSTKSFRLM